MKRWLTLLLAFGLFASLAQPAGAYWAGTGTGSGQILVDTLPAGNQPSGSAAGSTVTVSWSQSNLQGSPVGGFIGGGYNVLRYPAGGGPAVTPGGTCGGIVSGAGATLNCQETGTPVGAWRYTVTPVLVSWTGAESAQSATVTIAPAAPTLSSVTAANPPVGQTVGNLQVSWTAVAGATGYNLYRRTAAGSYNFAAPVNGGTPLAGTSYTDLGTGLAADTYYYVVRTVVGGAESANSNELGAATIVRPAPPTGVTSTLAPAADVTIGWTASAGATGYNVYRRTTAGVFNYAAPLNGATPVAGTSYLDITSVSGTAYIYVVRAVVIGAGGVQVQSTDSAQTPAVTADGTVPTGVTITNPGTPLRATITLTGAASDTISGVGSLRYQYKLSAAAIWSDACTGTVTPFSCAFDTTTTADGLYDFRVIASDVAGNTTTSASVTNRRIDNTAPALTFTNPGTPIIGTEALAATATDTGGSGVASVVFRYSPAGAGTWTTICTDTTSPYTCSWNSTTVADGIYDVSTLATDVAGNQSVVTYPNISVENSRPSGVDVQTTNVGGGTAGHAEPGDTIVLTYTEPMLSTSILAGWSGAATPMTVRATNGAPDTITFFNAANTVQIPLGSLRVGNRYFTANTTFTGSSMAMVGNTVVVTLGTPSIATPFNNRTANLRWTVVAGPTDLAGKPINTGNITEQPIRDLDF